MARTKIAVSCECGQRFYLNDTDEGECPLCNKAVSYSAPKQTPPKKGGKKKLDVLDNGMPAAAKYSGN